MRDVDAPPPAPLPHLGPRLARAFAAPRAGRAALIPYLTGGHPDLETSGRLIDAVTGAGADIVELGVPFSDPIADGPVVQRSTHQALARGRHARRRHAARRRAQRGRSVRAPLLRELRAGLRAGAVLHPRGGLRRGGRS